MTMARKMYLFGTALVVFLIAGAGAPVQAQPVCGWCSMDGDLVGCGPGWEMYEDALRKPREGFSFEFIPEAGRIEVVRSCNPGRAYTEISVPPEARRRLQEAVALHAAWRAG